MLDRQTLNSGVVNIAPHLRMKRLANTCKAKFRKARNSQKVPPRTAGVRMLADDACLSLKGTMMSSITRTESLRRRGGSTGVPSDPRQREQGRSGYCAWMSLVSYQVLYDDYYVDPRGSKGKRTTHDWTETLDAVIRRQTHCYRGPGAIVFFDASPTSSLCL